MKLHIVMHESFEAPAAIEAWAQKRGFEIQYTRLYSGATFPEVCDFDFLVVMGGPQSPATTVADCPHFDAQKEVAFIKKAIAEQKILLGVCLGAQLIGEAFGAHFEHSPNKEIGVFPITLTPDGKVDPIFRTFPEKFMVGHWHGDMPGLTPASKVLATSEGCPRQVVRYTPQVYGLQCHFEFTQAAVEGMIGATDELVKYKGLPYIETADQLRSHEYAGLNELLFTFLDELTRSRLGRHDRQV